MVSGDIYKMILKLYISKQKVLTRPHFCEVLGISETNSNSYKKIIEILNEVIEIRDNNVREYLEIHVNRNKLEELWRSFDYFKITDDAIHMSTAFAITG